jgi:hypothetical protein
VAAWDHPSTRSCALLRNDAFGQIEEGAASSIRQVLPHLGQSLAVLCRQHVEPGIVARLPAVRFAVDGTVAKQTSTLGSFKAVEPIINLWITFSEVCPAEESSRTVFIVVLTGYAKAIPPIPQRGEVISGDCGGPGTAHSRRLR